MTTQLKLVTLPGSGRTVVIPKLSISMLTLNLAQEHPKPDAPLQEVNLAGKKSFERNYASPAYAEALTGWAQDMATMQTEFVLRSVAKVNTIPADDLPIVADVRETYGDMVGRQSDQMLWLRYVACADDDDVRALMGAVRGLGEPDAQRVEAAADTFRR